MKILARARAIAMLVAAPWLVSAQTTAGRVCEDATYRQFDFWIGEWNVLDRAGKLAGTSVIQRSLDGCALTEAWSSGPTRGFSINFYDATAKQWHQTWIDNAGRALLLDGGLREGTMVLEGNRRTPDSRVSKQRITWSKLPQGEVRQLWESSVDAGTTWAVVFDGRYVPRSRNP